VETGDGRSLSLRSPRHFVRQRTIALITFN
jgi:hypothetical protein